MSEKAREERDKVTDMAESAKGNAKEYAYDTREIAKDAAGTVANKTKKDERHEGGIKHYMAES